MKKSTVKKIIAEGGATLKKSGAAVSFKRGYQVSARDCFTLDAANVEKITAAINSLLSEIGKNQFVGVWIDGGRAYIDISERIANRRDALRIGRERGQISVLSWAMKARGVVDPRLYC